MEIHYLADHLELAPLLAGWHHQEWADLLPGWTRQRAEIELQSHTGRRQIPTTFVAIENGRPLGSASLLESDLEGWEHLRPWVASVFVAPPFRGEGLGSRLVQRAVAEATALQVPTIYLFTAGQTAFYEKLGWEPWQQTAHHGRPVTIMRYFTPSR
jgi:predicted N-acetyltransferase YhbS